MVVMYNIMGRQVGSHHLALGILTSLFAGIGYASSGGAKKATGSTPPINASSKDEENFIQQFLKESEKKQDQAKH
ncbi:hypothetical protein E4T48_08447 [Aureobasidium sp. EXF-10727]|nr:hypothetical protein E4T48_08447 [Aureobasidium sp. EXF-10727]KAI4725926.1 hypothetical protein E4T49_06314 [Aureobasidium sp. EXF-10728]